MTLNALQQLRRTSKPRCDECDSTAATHPYPKPEATEWQLNGQVAGGYRWLCGDCAYKEQHGGDVVTLKSVAKKDNGPPQRERLFDLD